MIDYKRFLKKVLPHIIYIYAIFHFHYELKDVKNDLWSAVSQSHRDYADKNHYHLEYSKDDHEHSEYSEYGHKHSHTHNTWEWWFDHDHDDYARRWHSH